MKFTLTKAYPVNNDFKETGNFHIEDETAFFIIGDKKLMLKNIKVKYINITSAYSNICLEGFEFVRITKKGKSEYFYQLWSVIW